MKRIVPLIFSIAIFVGIALPFSATLSPQYGVRLSTSSVFAVDEVKTSGGTYTPPPELQGYLENCALFHWFDGDNSSMAGCIAQVVYVIPYELGAWAMAVAAEAFDAAASLTLSSALYTSGDLLTKGWTVTRDFANIFFILILLFAALSLVLNMDLGGANPKKMIGSVIVIAILINFSFFLTEVVVDISNSLALVFYNQISAVQKDKVTPIDNSKINDQLKDNNLIKNVKPISVTIVSGFRPQIFNDPSFYAKLFCARDVGFFTTPTKDCGGTADGATTAVSGDVSEGTQNKRVASGTIIPIMILVGCMYLVVAYSFGVALISLIGRMISLFIAIIFAPFAFVSTIVPKAKEIPGFGWNEWFSGLMTAAFAAPIYFFLLLLVTFIVKIPIIPPATANLSAGMILVLVIIQCAIVITLLLKATSYVEKASGTIGEMILKGAKVVGGAAVGLAGGAALGSLALAGQGTIGLLGKRLGENSRLTKWATDGGGGKNNFMNGLRRFTGRAIMERGQKLSKSSFDARHTGLGNAFTGATGINLGSFGALAAKNTAGGLEGAAARKAAKDEAFANTLKYNEQKEAELKTKKQEKEDAIAAQQVIADNAEEHLKQIKEVGEEALAPFEEELAILKANYQAIKDEAVSNNPADIAAKNLRLQEANAKINGGMVNGVLVAGIQKAVSDQKDMNKANLATVEAQYKTEKKKLSDLQNGEKDPVTGKVRDIRIGDTMLDGTVVDAGNIAGFRAKKMKSMETVGIKDFDELIENNKKGAARAFLAYEAQDSGYHTEFKYDAAGNIKGHHVDTNDKNGKRNDFRTFTRIAGAIALGGLTGNIADLSLAFSSFSVKAAAGFGLAATIKEAFGDMQGRSFIAAEAGHHTANPGGKHEHEHGVYHTPNTGFLASLASIFKMKAGGGGGGGGGGHAPAHH